MELHNAIIDTFFEAKLYSMIVVCLKKRNYYTYIVGCEVSFVMRTVATAVRDEQSLLATIILISTFTKHERNFA